MIANYPSTTACKSKWSSDFHSFSNWLAHFPLRRNSEAAYYHAVEASRNQDWIGCLLSLIAFATVAFNSIKRPNNGTGQQLVAVGTCARKYYTSWQIAFSPQTSTLAGGTTIHLWGWHGSLGLGIIREVRVGSPFFKIEFGSRTEVFTSTDCLSEGLVGMRWECCSGDVKLGLS